jgi:uncharacterized repeat protein (TIGR02543 family)
MTGYRSWIIPEGNVREVRDSLGRVMWSLPTTPSSCAYVSLGDSIAAGHSLNGWSIDTQYGSNGRQSTHIVPESYTDRIRQDLISKYGADKVSAISFARSGDRVSDLITKLDHTLVRTAISNANIVTICIGANDILGEVNESVLADYIDGGDPTLVALGERVQANLDILADNNNANSYRALFDKLRSINPKAKYVFMTIYNPYKYLHLDEGRNGFLYHILNLIPEIDLFGLDVDGFIKDNILNTPAIQTLFSRTNALAPWVETYVEKLNSVIRTKISEYNNANFIVAEAKAAFDVFPDRPHFGNFKHYNDLVNVEYTSEYETDDMDWGQLWGYDASGAAGYWLGLATKHLRLENFAVVGLDSLAAEFVAGMIEKVIVPDLDPHPKSYGQYVLKRAFADVIDLQPLEYYSITYNANGSTGSMPAQKVINIDGNPSVTTIRANSFVGATGYYFTGWNTSANGGGASYSYGQMVRLTGNLSLYAQWSNIYTLRVEHGSNIYDQNSSDTGYQEYYALWINGTQQPQLGAFANSPRIINLAYGSSIGVNVSEAWGVFVKTPAKIYLNGTELDDVRGSDGWTRYGFTMYGNVTVRFEWMVLGTQARWDCYVTTHY